MVSSISSTRRLRSFLSPSRWIARGSSNNRPIVYLGFNDE